MKHHRLHCAVWFVVRRAIRGYERWKYNFTPQLTPLPDEPYLVYANHVTHDDPFLLGLGFERHMYFVASEHLLRHAVGRVMMALAAPILRQKSRTETQTALEIVRRLRAGHNVCVCIEGERSYAGCTEYIPESAAHLALLAGTPLVTYRLENGYLSEPRWAHTVRRGRMSGHVVQVYSAQQLRELGREQTLAAIRRDLRLDAFAAQAREPIRYGGRARAEHVETVLFRCPQCGAVGTLHSCGDELSCSCGLRVRYTEYGWFETLAGVCRFTNVRDWYDWQLDWLPELAAAADPEQPLFFDDEQSLYQGGAGQSRLRLIGVGRFAMFADRVEFVWGGGRLDLPLDRISGFSNHDAMLVDFSSGQTLYELRSPHPRSGIKYRLLFDLLRQRDQAVIKKEDADDPEV